jgi:hypothetical protein
MMSTTACGGHIRVAMATRSAITAETNPGPLLRVREGIEMLPRRQRRRPCGCGWRSIDTPDITGPPVSTTLGGNQNLSSSRCGCIFLIAL